MLSTISNSCCGFRTASPLVSPLASRSEAVSPLKKVVAVSEPLLSTSGEGTRPSPTVAFNLCSQLFQKVVAVSEPPPFQTHLSNINSMSLTITGLFIYPIKSLAGISLHTAQVSDRGLEFDRRWMLIDENQVFLSQRTCPEMALLRPALEEGELVVHGKMQEPITIQKLSAGERLSVQIWDDHCEAIQYPEEVNEWFSREMGQTVRLVYMPDDSRRKVDPRFALQEEVVSFADGYPFLVISEESLAELNSRLDQPVPMNRFRPNLVIRGGEAFEEDRLTRFSLGGITFMAVKPCARCQVITIDQASAAMSKEPLKTLATYRRVGNKVLFGMNLLHSGGGKIEIGTTLEAVIYSH